MIICLSCYHCWPETAIYCGNCQRTFGGRRCLDAHLSPDNARYCLVCGSPDLSVPTKAIATARFCRIAAWVIAFFVLKPFILLFAKALLLFVVGFNFINILFRLLFGVGGLSLGGLLGPVLIVHVLFRLIRFLFGGLRSVIQGPPQANPLPPSRRSYLP